MNYFVLDKCIIDWNCKSIDKEWNYAVLDVKLF